MFLNRDRLVIFYHGFNSNETIPEFEYRPRQANTPATHAMILDVSDRGEPMVLKDYTVDGDLGDARMIGDYVYFVSTMWADYSTPAIPLIADAASGKIVLRPDVIYFDNFED